MINEKEKKYVYLAFTMIIIMLCIALYYIWSPIFKDGSSFSRKIAASGIETEEKYISKNVEKYKKLCLNFIDKNSFETTKDKINLDYLDNNNLNIDDVYNQLINDKVLINPSSSTVIYNSSIKNNGKEYIYTFKYKVGDNEKKIHIIEDYYEEYTISFDQDEYPIINNEGFYVSQNGLDYKISIKKSYESTMVLNVSVKNSSTDEYIYNINSIKDVYIKLDDNSIKYLNSVVIGADVSKIKSVPGSELNFDISFDINVEEQSKIRSITFDSITKTNGEISSVTIDLL